MNMFFLHFALPRQETAIKLKVNVNNLKEKARVLVLPPRVSDTNCSPSTSKRTHFEKYVAVLQKKFSTDVIIHFGSNFHECPEL